MNLRALRYFVTVANEMNFTEASQKLHITQQSLSGVIKRMEEEYGVAFFQRKPVLKLTPAGEIMVFHAKKLLRDEEDMIADFSDLSANCMGHISIGMSRQRSGVFFQGIWGRFHPLYKNISVHLHEKMTSALLEELRRGDLDMLIGVNVLQSQNLTLVPLATEQIQCLMSEQLLQEYFPDTWQSQIAQWLTEGVDFMELVRLPFLMLSAGNQMRNPIDQIFEQAGIRPKILLESADHNNIYQLGCAGSGVALFSPMILYTSGQQRLEIPAGCHLFALRNHLPQYQLSLVYRNDALDHHYLNGMKNAIMQEFSFYNAAMQRFSDHKRL